MAALLSSGNREESPDSNKKRCRVMPGRGNPTESATENKPPVTPQLALDCRQVRVKRWGKSPPRGWQQRRHGKPHLEQRQIGTACCICLRADQRSLLCSSRSGLAAVAVSATAWSEEWSSKKGNLRDKIRLIGLPRIDIRGGSGFFENSGAESSYFPAPMADVARYGVDSGRGRGRTRNLEITRTYQGICSAAQENTKWLSQPRSRSV